ncbi:MULTISPECIES: BCCT family transporter [Oceanimonas]|uniref:Choline transporter n=1 Tax=Oceanimonas doudoroffii TaxID=84158 RepID=A0A233RHQ9_9GAMM|nr:MULTISPECIES: BCCT family transporter [Oceanimonas]NHI00479.1 Glycine betaine transporter [Oceanimonas sp. MB9]OXY82914.1 choline transporter [Oceanimonas doudoroffii]
MDMVLSVAIVLTLTASVWILLRYGRVPCKGEMPTSLFTFIAILFTSGLDVGLVMFPLTEFPVYVSESVYGFASPLAIEFGFWGFLVWGFYFFTTFYFVLIEPRVRLFELPLVRFINNLVIIGTCAFTGYLFLSYLPDYVTGITPALRYGLVALVVLCAVWSSSDVRYVKFLSVASTWLFVALIAVMAVNSGAGVPALAGTMAEIGDYFGNLHRFVTPMSDYHAFYLFWWFSWSIMIGQFVARFAGGLPAWQLCLAMLVVPSIPIAIWFSVLYLHFSEAIAIGNELRLAMVVVGVIFVINSLDSLIRLYTTNLGMEAEKLGKGRYLVLNWTLMFVLVLLFQFTPLKIEWVGLVVIGLYALIAVLLWQRRAQCRELGRGVDLPARAASSGR